MFVAIANFFIAAGCTTFDLNVLMYMYLVHQHRPGQLECKVLTTVCEIHSYIVIYATMSIFALYLLYDRCSSTNELFKEAYAAA